MGNFLTEEHVKVLKLTHRTIKDKKLADRIKAILMLHFGFTYSQISQALLLDETTLRRYESKFQNKGIDCLLECHFTGGQSKLSLIQQTELKKYLQENIMRTAKEVAFHIQKTYCVKFTLVGATKLLHRLDFTYKKPKIIPGKADSQKQAEFLKNMKKLKPILKKKMKYIF